MEVELPHPVGVVVAHGLRDDPKFCRDFLGTVAFGYRLKDLNFTVDEEIWRILQWSNLIGDDVAQERRDCALDSAPSAPGTPDPLLSPCVDGAPQPARRIVCSRPRVPRAPTVLPHPNMVLGS